MPSPATVVHLRAGQNYIESGSDKYLMVCDADGVAHTIAGNCAHRGGPLQLGAMDATERFIVCPWHKTRTSLTAAIAKELPTVRRGATVSVVLEAPNTAVHSLRRTVLLDCKLALSKACAIAHLNEEKAK